MLGEKMGGIQFAVYQSPKKSWKGTETGGRQKNPGLFI